MATPPSPPVELGWVGLGWVGGGLGVLKMAENHEKQCFTFFAFLPPYIGVSGSLVSRKRKSVKRSIDWYQKFLISCLATRYSAVLGFYVPPLRVKMEIRQALCPGRVRSCHFPCPWAVLVPLIYS